MCECVYVCVGVCVCEGVFVLYREMLVNKILFIQI